MIGTFVTTLAGYQPKTVEHKLCAVRSLLRFAATDGLVDDAVLTTVPAVKSVRQARVPSVWDPGEVAKILEAIDRGNPSGKRDYAIVLLICRLGLRAVDVKRLEFADLDWPGNQLSVVQAKTGRRVVLPLLKDVGWAIIDYVRDGRPRCDCPQVFLRHTAPIGPFSDQDHLHQILVKHARAARVGLGQQRRRGMHSLRHTLATRLMEDGTPVERISEILGHQSVESTGVYLKSSLRPVGASARWTRTPRRSRCRGRTRRRCRDERGDHARQRDRGAGRGEARHRLQVCERGAGAGAFRGVLRHASSPASTPSRERRVEAWITAARGRAVKPATVINLTAPVRELARWLGRRGVEAYVLPSGVLPKPARYVPHIYTDRELGGAVRADRPLPLLPGGARSGIW